MSWARPRLDGGAGAARLAQAGRVCVPSRADAVVASNGLRGLVVAAKSALLQASQLIPAEDEREAALAGGLSATPVSIGRSAPPLAAACAGAVGATPGDRPEGLVGTRLLAPWGAADPMLHESEHAGSVGGALGWVAELPERPGAGVAVEWVCVSRCA